VAVAAGGTYRLAFEVRFTAGPPGEGQRPNVYVGVRTTSASGAQFLIDSPLRSEWTPGEIVFRAAEGKTEVLVFLSLSGTLDVRAVTLEKLAPAQSFDVLVRNMGRYYSFFGHAKVDWEKHAATFRERAGLATDQQAFASLLNDLLAPLHDLHTVFQAPGGKRQSAGVVPVTPNVDARLKEAVKNLKPVTKDAQVLVGELEAGIPYVAFTSLLGGEDDWKKNESAVLALLPDSKGLVLDLRPNIGGNETWARQIVQHFADQPRVYARRAVRSGPGPDDFGAWHDVWLRPVGGAGKPFTKPIVVLLGPACVSSGEGMAQMLDVLPHVRTVGQPTRGASGSPTHLPLPNDFDVWFSTWKNQQADGTDLEGRGVQPDIPVEHKGDGDPTLAAGLAELHQMLAR
jgi:carboxyl-terminal processing protease